jgi:hypothetical protein
MAIIAADISRPWLPAVRRLEAAGFRAWPASTVRFDGSWQIRMTPGHPSKRLNSLVPLDPADAGDMGARIKAAERLFDAAGLKAAIRQSPLCPPGLPDILTAAGWTSRHDTLVMAADLDDIDLSSGLDHLPTHDLNRVCSRSLSSRRCAARESAWNWSPPPCAGPSCAAPAVPGCR